MNPLITNSPKETAQNIAEAMSALITLMADRHSDLCRLMSPIQSAIEHIASK
jgi:hypothetical protein